MVSSESGKCLSGMTDRTNGRFVMKIEKPEVWMMYKNGWCHLAHTLSVTAGW
ncbi:MAG: hypothetical protein ACP5MB_08340 [bacterium]